MVRSIAVRTIAVSTAVLLTALPTAFARQAVKSPPPDYAIETLSPADALPVEYPLLIFFKLTNRSADEVDVGFFTNSDFDLEITDSAGKSTRKPLDKSLHNGLIPQYKLSPGQGKWFAAGIDRLPVGTYKVRILPAASKYMDAGGLPIRSVLSVPDEPQPATICIDAKPATRDKWLTDMKQRLEHFDAYIAHWALHENIGPLHGELLDMLADPPTRRCSFAAEAFRTSWRQGRDTALDRTLMHALAADEALPMKQRTGEVDGALMNLVQSEARPEFLDTVIRFSRPKGSRSPSDALLALQAYRSDPKAIEATAAMLDDPNNDAFAAELLCDWRRDERALPVLEKYAFVTEGRFTQPYIFWHQIIRYGPNPRVMAIVQRGLSDPRPEIVMEAKAALAKLSPPTTLPAGPFSPLKL